jgi:uncharacterized protein
MSAENIEVVRAAYAAFTKGDLLENFAQIPQFWSEFSVQPDEFIDAGDHVIVRGVQRAVGAGGSSESRYLHLLELRGGLLVRGEFIADSAKSLAALGERTGVN